MLPSFGDKKAFAGICTLSEYFQCGFSLCLRHLMTVAAKASAAFVQIDLVTTISRERCKSELCFYVIFHSGYKEQRALLVAVSW